MRLAREALSQGRSALTTGEPACTVRYDLPRTHRWQHGGGHLHGCPFVADQTTAPTAVQAAVHRHETAVSGGSAPSPNGDNGPGDRHASRQERCTSWSHRWETVQTDRVAVLKRRNQSSAAPSGRALAILPPIWQAPVQCRPLINGETAGVTHSRLPE